MAKQSAITVDQVPAQSVFRTVVLTGKNSPDIATLVVTGVAASVIQPTPVTWRAELRLSPGSNTFRISGVDVGGNVTESLTFTIELTRLVMQQHRVLNPLDEHGILLAVPRLPGEKNLPYLNRLKDSGLHPSDTTPQGVIFGAARGVALRIRPAINLRSPRDVDTGEPRAVDGTVVIGPVFMDLRSARLVADECLRIEPATQQIQLANSPASQVVRITTLEGDEIPDDLYVVDQNRQTVRFLTHELNGLEVRAIFRRRERISLLGRTLSQLKAAVEAVTDIDGVSLFELTVRLPGATPAENLIPTKGLIIVGSVARVFEACPLRLRELWNYDFQQSKLNADGHAIDTKLEAWAREVNTQARVIWDATFLGESFWEPLGEDPRLGALPHLTDAARGHWQCQDPTDGAKYTLKQFRATNGLCPVDGTPLEYHGILPLEFQSGTGTGDDLSVRDVVAVRTED